LGTGLGFFTGFTSNQGLQFTFAVYVITYFRPYYSKIGREDTVNGAIAFVCVSTNEKCLVVC